MKPHLKILSGPAEGRIVELDNGHSLTVGRGQECDLMFGDALMSSKHFRLEFSDHSCKLFDLRSKNATYVNGIRVTQTNLMHGQIIVAGMTSFQYCTGMDVRSRLKIDTVATEFERGWTINSAGDYDRFLKRVEPENRAELICLLAEVDIELHLKNGLAVATENFQQWGEDVCVHVSKILAENAD